MTAEQQPGVDPYFGRCPLCLQGGTVMITVGRDHWAICEPDKTRWWVGSNLFSAPQEQTEEQYEAAAARLAPYREVESVSDTARAEGIQEDGHTTTVESRFAGLKIGGFATQTTHRVRYKDRIFDVKVGSALPPRFDEPEYWWAVEELDPEDEEPLDCMQPTLDSAGLFASRSRLARVML